MVTKKILKQLEFDGYCDQFDFETNNHIKQKMEEVRNNLNLGKDHMSVSLEDRKRFYSEVKRVLRNEGFKTS